VATPGDQQITLTWTNPSDPDLVGIQICRSKNGFPAQGVGVVKTCTAGETSWLDTYGGAGLTNDTTYYYRLYSYDAQTPANFSSGSQVSAIPADTTPPGAVTNLVATAGDAQVGLTWTNPGATDYAETVVRRKTGSYPTSPTDGTAVYSGTGESTTATGLTNGTTYYFAAWARDEVATNWSSPAAQATATPQPTEVTVTFYSDGTDDGWVLESGENTNVGGTFSAAMSGDQGTRIGDHSSDWQYKSLYSFDTSSIPDTATIVSAEFRFNRAVLSGSNPFGLLGNCQVDIRSGGFNGDVALEAADFQATATATNVATMNDPGADGAWSAGTLGSTGRSAVNKTGKTQLRVYFATGDNDDMGGDYIGVCPGEYSDTTRRPKLTITYQP